VPLGESDTATRRERAAPQCGERATEHEPHCEWAMSSGPHEESELHHYGASELLSVNHIARVQWRV
jgi:hypothetical protein